LPLVLALDDPTVEVSNAPSTTCVVYKGGQKVCS